jgi:predicted nucleotidyltransferase
MEFHPQIIDTVQQQKYPLIFVTISGAHLYGFPSPDSDYDLRGVHVLPPREVVGLETGPETIQSSEKRSGLEIDLVSHDIKKFFKLLLKRNGYVLEQLFSPLVVFTTPEHQELKEIATGCITKHHSHHYLGFAQTEWKLLNKENPKRIKPLLYVYRVLLTGIHLMRTGKVEANLQHLNQIFKLPYIPDLISQKMSGAEQSVIKESGFAFHETEYERLRAELEKAGQDSNLPEIPSAQLKLNDLLIRTRLRGN